MKKQDFKKIGLIAALSAVSSCYAQSWGSAVPDVVKPTVQNIAAKLGLDSTAKKAEPAKGTAPTKDLTTGWGDQEPMPFRGRPTAEQMADERLIDDRFKTSKTSDYTKRNKQKAQEGAVSAIVPVSTSKTSIPVLTKVVSRPHVESACAGMKEKWDKADVLSKTDPEASYAQYVSLLTNCLDDKEQKGTAFHAAKNLPSVYVGRLLVDPALINNTNQSAYYIVATQQFYALNKKNSTTEALELGRSLKDQFINEADVQALIVLGWLEHNVKNDKEAQLILRSALRLDKENNQARLALITSYLSSGKIAQAQNEAVKLDDSSVVDAELNTAVARAAYKDKEYPKALQAITLAEKAGAASDEQFMALKAWILRGAGYSDKSYALFKELNAQYPQNKEYAAGLVEVASDLNDKGSLTEIASQGGPSSERAKLALADKLKSQGRTREAAELSGEPLEKASSTLGGFVAVRGKTGVAGEDRLTVAVAPEGQFTVPLSDSTALKVAAANVHVNDGIHANSGKEARASVESKSGDLTLVGGAGISSVNNQNRMTFELRARSYTDDGFLEGGLQKEPVIDSVRSYAGINTTLPNGQVSTTGQAMDSKFYVLGSHQLMNNQYKLDWRASAGVIAGKNFESTGYIDTRASVTKDFKVPGFSWVSAGPEVRLSHYGMDQNRYSAGYGGFFSPLSELDGGLKVSLMSEEGRKYLYKLNGFAGLSRKSYSTATDLGFMLEADAGLSYLLNNHLIAKTGATFKTTSGYFDVGGYVGLEVSFDKKQKLSADDVTGFKLGK